MAAERLRELEQLEANIAILKAAAQKEIDGAIIAAGAENSGNMKIYCKNGDTLEFQYLRGRLYGPVLLKPHNPKPCKTATIYFEPGVVVNAAGEEIKYTYYHKLVYKESTRFVYYNGSADNEVYDKLVYSDGTFAENDYLSQYMSYFPSGNIERWINTATGVTVWFEDSDKCVYTIEREDRPNLDNNPDYIDIKVCKTTYRTIEVRTSKIEKAIRSRGIEV